MLLPTLSVREQIVSDIQKLREEHAELVVLVGKLGVAVDLPEPPPFLELFALRRDLTSTLIGHLKAEDWALYPRLMESKDARIAATANAFSDEMGGLAAAFNIYSTRWSAMSITSDWNGFCHESKAIIDTLTCRITRENRELYPLIDEIDQAA